jgi:uncharacterized membrane protein YgdD (TMEM256/DUF423 family)
MPFSRISMIAGALLGMLAVIAGAMGAHALKEVLTPDQMESFRTGVRYQMFHAILLLVLGWWSKTNPHRLIAWASRLVLAGVILFSGSIYLLVLTEAPKWIGPVTPLGGVLMIGGWICLLLFTLREAGGGGEAGSGGEARSGKEN